MEQPSDIADQELSNLDTQSSVSGAGLARLLPAVEYSFHVCCVNYSDLFKSRSVMSASGVSRCAADFTAYARMFSIYTILGHPGPLLSGICQTSLPFQGKSELLPFWTMLTNNSELAGDPKPTYTSGSADFVRVMPATTIIY